MDSGETKVGQHFWRTDSDGDIGIFFVDGMMDIILTVEDLDQMLEAARRANPKKA